jgi:uncharacterized membrane protein YesL
MWKTVFDPENRFWSFMNKLTDLFFLSLFWLLCSLPVVTMGAATVALYQFTLKQVDDSEGYAFRSFWKAFRQNFVKATLLWLLTLGLFTFFFFDYYALATVSLPSILQIALFGLVTCLALLFQVMDFYAFPLLALYHVGVKKALHDGLVMGLQHLPTTILVAFLFTVLAVITYKVPYLAFLCVAVYLFFSSYLFRRVFAAYEER